MEPVSEAHFQSILARAALHKAEPRTGIGAQISYANAPLRSVVIHFAESDSGRYVESATVQVLKLSGQWLLAPRYGDAGNLRLIEGISHAAAIRFDVEEHLRLAAYLCTRPMDHGSLSTDLYVISERGDILVTWDHHTAEEGLRVELNNVTTASQLLVGLNELGAEFEVYYANG